MINFRYIKSWLTVILCAVILTGSNLYTDKATAETAVPQQCITKSEVQNTISPLSIVNSPKAYLNKKITMKAKFDKFSTLGLDYKPALRSTTNYISFLIKREDTTYNIPLSEMKLFLDRKSAEKFIDLKTDDEIKIEGTVFSDALGDAWIDVENITVLKKAPDKDGVK